MLANALRDRFLHTGSLADVQEGVYIFQKSTALTKAQPELHIGVLLELGIAHRARGSHIESSADADLKEAINLHREVLRLLEETSAAHGPALAQLAETLLCAYKRFENTDVDESIMFQRQALELGHPDRHRSLAKHLMGERIQSLLTEVEAVGRDALACCIHGHRDRPLVLNQLATIHLHFLR